MVSFLGLLLFGTFLVILGIQILESIDNQRTAGAQHRRDRDLNQDNFLRMISELRQSTDIEANKIWKEIYKGRFVQIKGTLLNATTDTYNDTKVIVRVGDDYCEWNVNKEESRKYSRKGETIIHRGKLEGYRFESKGLFTVCYIMLAKY